MEVHICWLRITPVAGKGIEQDEQRKEPNYNAGLTKPQPAWQGGLEWVLSIRIVHFELKRPNLASSSLFPHWMQPASGWGCFGMRQLCAAEAGPEVADSWSVDSCSLATVPTVGQHGPHWRRVWIVTLHADPTFWPVSLQHCMLSYVLFIDGLTCFLQASWGMQIFCLVHHCVLSIQNRLDTQ